MRGAAAVVLGAEAAELAQQGGGVGQTVFAARPRGVSFRGCRRCALCLVLGLGLGLGLRRVPSDSSENCESRRLALAAESRFAWVDSNSGSGSASGSATTSAATSSTTSRSASAYRAAMPSGAGSISGSSISGSTTSSAASMSGASISGASASGSSSLTSARTSTSASASTTTSGSIGLNLRLVNVGGLFGGLERLGLLDLSDLDLDLVGRLNLGLDGVLNLGLDGVLNLGLDGVLNIGCFGREGERDDGGQVLAVLNLSVNLEFRLDLDDGFGYGLGFDGFLTGLRGRFRRRPRAPVRLLQPP